MSRPTRLEDLATLAGVSIATVSRALSDHAAVADATKRRVWALALEHDYPFRRYAAGGPVGAEATIAVIIPRPQSRSFRLADPFTLALIAAVGEAARERACDLVISHVSPSNHDELMEAMRTNRADGVIFLGQSTLHEEFESLAATGTNFVVWGAQLPRQHYCSVGSDNRSGGERATRHLLRLGRRRILFLGDAVAPEVAQRYSGYAEALKAAHRPIDPALVVAAPLDLQAGDAAVSERLAGGLAFDGVVAASDLIALGALRALARAGRSVPGDVSVIGYDNVPFAAWSHPTLSTISQDVERAGRLLVSKLLSATGTGELASERVPTELVVRDSCGG